MVVIYSYFSYVCNIAGSEYGIEMNQFAIHLYQLTQ